MKKDMTIVKTGIKALDETLGGGISKNGLTTVLGRSGVGKTILLLALAVKSKKNVAFYSPKLGFGELKARIAKLCLVLDINQKDVSYEINDSLWMTVKFPDHVIRVASEVTRAMVGKTRFLSSLNALVESGAVKMALVDSPCYISDAPGGKASRKEIEEMMEDMTGIAARCGVPIVVTMLAPKSLDTSSSKAIDEWLDDHVCAYSVHVILVDGWPEVKGRNAMLSIAVLGYDETEDEWDVKRGTVKMKHVFGNHSIHYAS